MNGTIRRVSNQNGPEITYSEATGVKLIERDGCYFKDLAKTGELLPYEDWRLSPERRAEDLAGRMTIEQIAGLMLYSNHQTVPADPVGHFAGTYNGKPYLESGAGASDLTDQQNLFLRDDNVRNVLLAKVDGPRVAANWNNNLQELSESLPLGIPVNTCSDPRHGAEKMATEYKGGGGQTSKWPEGIAMAATFDPKVCEEFARIASSEYRALGIATALSPQIDLATEPRWMRFGDTFGEHVALTTDMGRAYCDGMQTTAGTESGWGNDSVGVMAKHWPGGGTGEAGRDAHYGYGKYAVYPGNNFEQHMLPFTEGAFKLHGPTGCAASVMPYYTISYGQGDGENVGNAYSRYMITHLLRGKYGYQGVVCTDWGITGDYNPKMMLSSPRCWGLEQLSESERHFILIENGVDQFGGNNLKQPVLDAYLMYCERHGEEAARKRFEQSAARLLVNSFRCGLFENPYLDPARSEALVGCAEHVASGLDAQAKSVVMLKNADGVLPIQEKLKVYIPRRSIGSYRSFFGFMTEPTEFDPIHPALLSEYFVAVDEPEQADFAIVVVETPITDAYSEADRDTGGNGYLPISLQYRPYTAEHAREVSIAGGDPSEDFTNRSYRGKTAAPANESDLDNVIETRRRLGSKPLIVVAELNKPTVLAELEIFADAIVAEFGVSMKAVLEIISGRREPSGLFPMQLPSGMLTVETQAEDVPFDMDCYVDTQGYTYDFGFGLNWSGAIDDWRTETYKKQV